MSVQNEQSGSVTDSSRTQDVSPVQIGLIGIGLLVCFVFFLYLLIVLWPTKGQLPEAITPSTSATAPAAPQIQPPLPVPTPVPTLPGQNAGDWNPDVIIFGRHARISSDVRFLLIVALAAGIGSFVQIATSFSTFLGNRQFRSSWIWWYLLRIPIGMSLALLFYFAVRGGFFTTVSGMDINPFGIAALGGLVGMFSKQAADKLQDVFEELFKSEQDQARNDKLTPNTTPTITSSNPATLINTSRQLTLSGAGFIQGATATINGAHRATAYVDARTLTITLEQADVQTPTTLSVVVTNPQLVDRSSTPYNVRVQ